MTMPIFSSDLTWNCPTVGVVELSKNDPIMYGMWIWLFRHYENKKAYNISDCIYFRGAGTEGGRAEGGAHCYYRHL